MQADTLVEAAESRTLGRLTNPVRGALQASAAVGAAVLASSLLSRTPAEPGTRWTLVFYGAAVVGTFTVSGLYHSVPWGPEWKRRMRRLDHVMIYLMIAGSITPLAVILLDGRMRAALLAVNWGIAGYGIVHKLAQRRVSLTTSMTLQVVQGWSTLLFVAPILDGMPPRGAAAMVVVGLLYGVGVVVLATKRPRLWPRAFSYHELFHVLVMAAAYAHYLVIVSVTVA